MEQQHDTEVPTEPCAWCGEPSVDRIIVRPGRKKKKLASVCRSHLEHFTAQGVKAESDEIHEQAFREQKRKADRDAYLAQRYKR